MYFLAGDKEDDNVANEISQTVIDMNKMASLLKKTGFPSEQLIAKVVPNGKHK